MHPILLATPWFNVYSYGFILAISYSVCTAMTIYKAKQNGLDGGTIFDLMMMLLVVGIFGSRLLFVLEYVPQKLITKDFLCFEQGGLTFYGSIISGIIFTIIYSKITKISFWIFADSFGFSLGPATAIARIGCFLNGCCYGKACSPLIGFQSRIAGTGYYHATQLYESFLSFIAFLILIFFIRKKQSHYGQLFLSYISLYAFFRFFIEFIRAENPVVLLGMTLSQVISIILIVTSIIVWKFIRNNKDLEIKYNSNKIKNEEVVK